jgi:hypothetical protein
MCEARPGNGALLLKVAPQRVGAINTVLVTKGVRGNEIRKETAAAARLIA